MKKIAIALFAAFALVGVSTNSSPVSAAASPAPSLTSPLSNTVFTGAVTVTFQLGAAHLSGSVKLLLMNASNSNIVREIFIGNSGINGSRIFSGEVDLLAADSTLMSNPSFTMLTTKINNVSNTTDRMPGGRYSITVAYQDASGNSPSIATSTQVGLDACGLGFFSSTNNGFAPSPGGCQPAFTGAFVNTIGATSQTLCSAGTYQSYIGSTSCENAPAGSIAPIPGTAVPTACSVGTYQPNSGQITCLQSAAGHFVDQPGATSQQQCSPGTYQPNPAMSSCIQASVGSYVAGSAATSETVCAAGTTSTNRGAAMCVPIVVTPIAPASSSNKRLGMGKKAKLSSMIKPTKGAKLKWSVSGGCKVSGIFIVAPKKATTCSLSLKQTVTTKVKGKNKTTTSKSNVGVTVS